MFVKLVKCTIFSFKVWKVVVSVNGFGLYLWQYVAIIFVTLDRLLTVLFRTYTQIWTQKKTKILIFTCWLIELMGCMAPYLSHKLSGFNNKDMIDIYIKTLLDVIFIILCITSYSAMFCKYVRSHRRTIQVQVSRENNRQPNTAWHLFRRSRFVIAVFLITSFLLCVSIPDIVLSVLILNKRRVPDILFKVFLFLSAVSDTMDAFVYVFSKAEVRKALWNIMKINCIRRRDRVSVATVSDVRRQRRIESQSSKTRSFNFD